MKSTQVKSAFLKSFVSTILAIFSVLSVEAQVVIQRCDTKTGWEGNAALSIDQSDKKEGRASLKTDAISGESTWFSKSFSQTQTGIDNTGFLCFWLYVSDASKMLGGQVEISSSGLPDVEESSWTLDNSQVSDGWNMMQLQISSANQTGGGADLDKINFFRIVQNLSESITAKIDFVRFAPDVSEPAWPLLDVPVVDNSSLDGKVMFGYQGWFNHPDDGAGLGWVHWGNFYEPINSTVDMYPDLREYGLDEQYKADLTYPNGRMAPVFSSFNRNTVVRHMKWVRDYDLDGVFVQRFISAAGSLPKMNHKDTVTTHVIEGCEKYGRVFAIMYDGIGNRVDDIKEDWKHLVDDIKVTESDRYLNHRGLPLVALWGYTVRDEATVDQLIEMIEFFKNNPEPKYRASLLLGVAWDWYDQNSTWMDAFRDVQVISPWFSGNTDYNKGQAWCDENNVDFLPVVHPGFSWWNLKGANKNSSPRNGGNFLWDEVNEVVSNDAKSVYIAMFDEIDEGTAMFKLAENHSMCPVEGYWLPLDEDGYDLPSDWYLREASLVTDVVRGYEDNHSSLVTPPEGIMTIRIINEVNNNDAGGMEFIFPDFPDESSIEISIDNGASYQYTTPDNVGTYEISPLVEGTYHVFVRHAGGGIETDMGEVHIGNSIEIAPSVASEPYPADAETDVRTELTLGWKEGENVHKNVIYFGTSNPPDSVNIQFADTYQPEELQENTTYYWKIDEVNGFGRADGPVWSFTTGSVSSGDEIVLDYCDSEGGWNSSNGINIDTQEKKEGYASLISSGGGTDWFKKTYSIALNTFCDSTSYLDLWIYVSDVSKFNGGGQLEITSAGKPDENEYNWLVGDLNLSNGWNDLHLQIKTANKMGNPDLSAINFFRLYQHVSGDVVSRIDYIRFSGKVFEPLAAPANLTATPGDSLINLDWDDNTESSLAGYNIYRANMPGISYFKINTELVEASEYADENLDNGSKYYYYVTAVDNHGNESEESERVSATPQGTNLVSTIRDLGMRVYPNPVEDMLYLEVENGIAVRFFDCTGRFVKYAPIDYPRAQIDLNELKSGIYFMEVRSSLGIQLVKLIKR